METKVENYIENDIAYTKINGTWGMAKIMV
jgi:hypothetical protein